jgi:hypothetical protein
VRQHLGPADRVPVHRRRSRAPSLAPERNGSRIVSQAARVLRVRATAAGSTPAWTKSQRRTASCRESAEEARRPGRGARAAPRSGSTGGSGAGRPAPLPNPSSRTTAAPLAQPLGEVLRVRFGAVSRSESSRSWLPRSRRTSTPELGGDDPAGRSKAPRLDGPRST